jgi:hypothetical protein
MGAQDELPVVCPIEGRPGDPAQRSCNRVHGVDFWETRSGVGMGFAEHLRL